MSDPVLREYKVLVTSQLAAYLHLVQIPSRSHLPSSQGGVLPARFKKSSRHFEVEVPVDTKHKTYSRERGADLATSSQTGSIKVVGHGLGGPQPASSTMLDKVTLSGGPVDNLHAKYFVGLVRDDELHLTPVQSVIQLRPSLTYLDDIDAKNKVANKKLTDLERNPSGNSPSESAARAIQVQFKKKETEEQIAARLNSYAYQKRQVDEEPWIKVSHFSHDSQEAERVAERLVLEKTDNSIEFKKVTPKEYLTDFFK